jgi:hypothetical protein
MFKNDFQVKLNQFIFYCHFKLWIHFWYTSIKGGNYFEIFNPAIKDPLSITKVTGSHGVQKIFDKEVKGSIYQLDGSPTTTKLSIPKDAKQGCNNFNLFLR